MGSITAMELREQLSLDVALRFHLRGNHYPPVPISMVKPCKKAIECGNRSMWDDDWDEMIDLPDDVSWKGNKQAPASDIISSHHLEWFLENEDD